MTVDMDVAESIPTDVEGRFLGRSDRQAFYQTATTLKMGMCGGPVLNAAGECVAVTEGIVPVEVPPNASQARQAIAGAAVCIEAPVLQAFVHRVEQTLLAELES